MLKTGTLRGCLVNIQNLIFKGVEPLIPFILYLPFLERARARELERIREKGRRRLEIFEDQDHQSSVWVINYS